MRTKAREVDKFFLFGPKKYFTTTYFGLATLFLCRKKTMQEKVKQHLTKLHETLDKEFKDLSGLRNELILAKNYSLATEIQRLEERLHSGSLKLVQRSS